MIAQFSAVETLRPPNFSTTQGESGYGVSAAWLAPSTGCDDMNASDFAVSIFLARR